MKPIEKNQKRCISCRNIKTLNSKGFCIHCEKGYGGNVEAVKVPKDLQYSHLSNKEIKEFKKDKNERFI